MQSFNFFRDRCCYYFLVYAAEFIDTFKIYWSFLNSKFKSSIYRSLTNPNKYPDIWKHLLVSLENRHDKIHSGILMYENILTSNPIFFSITKFCIWIIIWILMVHTSWFWKCQYACIPASVLVALPQVSISGTSFTVNYGSPITIGCNFTSNPSASGVTWQRTVGGQSQQLSVISSSKYTGGTLQSPSLTIFNTNSSDEGFYTCSVTNSIGTASSSSAYLDVIGSEL